MATRIKILVRDQLQFECEDGVLTHNANVLAVWEHRVPSNPRDGSGLVFLYVVPLGNYARIERTDGGMNVKVNE